MSNIWRVESSRAGTLEQFLSRDFDPVQLWEDYGYQGTLYVYDQSDRDRPVCRIEDRKGRAWVQPLDEKGKPTPFEWH